MAKVRYTGERSKRPAIVVPKHGTVSIGDVIEVTDDQAQRWTEPQVTGERGTAEDLAEAWTLDELRVMARDHGLDDSGRSKAEVAERIYAHDPNAGTPQIKRSDFEAAGDSEKATAAPRTADADEGVTDGQ